MTGRVMATPVAEAFEAPILNIAWIIRLEIVDDPVYAWTGAGDLYIPPGTFSDPKLNNTTFTGLANIAEIGKIIDTMQGSQAVRLSLPGVKLNDELLQQILYDQRQWQGRYGYIWVVPLTTGGALLGEPVRAKTGKMDNLRIEKRQSEGVVRVDLEAFNAYQQRALNTRYSEQKEIDATDISQDYVHDLANKTVALGDKVNATYGYQPVTMNDLKVSTRR